jgi:hypothetical protein
VVRHAATPANLRSLTVAFLTVASVAWHRCLTFGGRTIRVTA